MAEFDEKYNYFFNQIVENDDDFVGSMAYVLYKRNKIEYIERYKKEHENKEPDLIVLREWQKGECIKSKLENYKTIAVKKSVEFINNLQSDKEKQLNKRKSELDKKEREIKERERIIGEQEKVLQKRNKYCQVKPRGQYWIGVSQSLVASLLFIIVCFIIIIYLSGNADFISWMHNVLGTK